MITLLADVPIGTPGDHISTGIAILLALLAATALLIAISSKKGGKR